MSEAKLRAMIRTEIAAALRQLSAEFKREALREDHMIAHQIDLFLERYERRK